MSLHGWPTIQFWASVIGSFPDRHLVPEFVVTTQDLSACLSQVPGQGDLAEMLAHSSPPLVADLLGRLDGTPVAERLGFLLTEDAEGRLREQARTLSEITSGSKKAENPIQDPAGIVIYGTGLRIGIRCSLEKLIALHRVLSQSPWTPNGESEFRTLLSEVTAIRADLSRYDVYLKQTSLRRIDFNPASLRPTLKAIDEVLNVLQGLDVSGPAFSSQLPGIKRLIRQAGIFFNPSLVRDL